MHLYTYYYAGINISDILVQYAYTNTFRENPKSWFSTTFVMKGQYQRDEFFLPRPKYSLLAQDISTLATGRYIFFLPETTTLQLSWYLNTLLVLPRIQLITPKTLNFPRPSILSNTFPGHKFMTLQEFKTKLVQLKAF